MLYCLIYFYIRIKSAFENIIFEKLLYNDVKQPVYLQCKKFFTSISVYMHNLRHIQMNETHYIVIINLPKSMTDKCVRAKKTLYKCNAYKFNAEIKIF